MIIFRLKDSAFFFRLVYAVGIDGLGYGTQGVAHRHRLSVGAGAVYHEQVSAHRQRQLASLAPAVAGLADRADPMKEE